jgi:hypothetical protein
MANEIETVDETEQVEASAPTQKRESNLAFVITLIALLIYFAFQTLQVVVERNNLGLMKGNQDGALQEAQKVQAQFKTLVTKTSELADQGHAGAKLVIEGLQSQGLGLATESSAPPSKTETKAAK